MIKVHYIKNEEGNEIAFFPKTKRFFKINKVAKSMIADIIGEKGKDYCINKYNLKLDEFKNYYTVIYGESTEAKCESNCACENEKKVLNRLVIHLTNTCNLACVYCYANGGNYLSKDEILDKKTLHQIIDLFYGEFDIIRTVQFFGGEPLMNVPMLEEACKIIRKIEKERNYTGRLGMVTNGTIYSDKIVELIKEYDINLTFSYDGDPEVNDMARVDKMGNGTSKKIIENMKKYYKETGQPNTVEVTYNQYHVNNNVSISNVIKHIHSIIPDLPVHLIPVGGDSADPLVVKDLSIFPESVNEMFNRMNQHANDYLIGNSTELYKDSYSYSLIDRFILGLSNREAISSPYICDAGLGTISVSTKGDIYPCFMFTDQEEMILGSIYEPNVFRSKKYESLMRKLTNFSIKENNNKCQNCFLYSLCNGCLGLNNYHTNNPLELSDTLCNMFRNMGERVIVELANGSETQKALEDKLVNV